MSQKTDVYPYLPRKKICKLDLAIAWGGRMDLLRHAKRRKHQDNVKLSGAPSTVVPSTTTAAAAAATASDGGQPEAKDSAQTYGEFYCSKWENEERFKEWLSPSVARGEHFAFCKLCQFDLSVASAGRMDLVRHTKSKRHLSNLAAADDTFLGDDVLSSSRIDKRFEVVAIELDQASAEPTNADNDSYDKSGTTDSTAQRARKRRQMASEPPRASESSATGVKRVKYFQRYHEDWEDEELFKDWLMHSVNKGMYYAYCRACNIDLAIGSSGKIDLIRHLKSNKHSKNMQQNADLDGSMIKSEMEPPFKKSYTGGGSSKDSATPSVSDSESQDGKLKGWCRQKFREEWCSEPQFEGWLEPVPEDLFRAWCKCCQCTLSVGRSELMKHAVTAKHKRGMIDINSVGIKVLSILEGAGGTAGVTKLTSGLNKIVDEGQLRAELRVAAFAVQNDLSNQAVQQLSDLVNGLAESTDVIGRMKLSRDKCAALVKQVLARAVHHELDEVLQHQPFSLIVEEPSGAGGDRRIFCVIAKYFSEGKNRVRSELLETFAVEDVDGDDPSTKAMCDIIVERLCRRRIPLKNLVGVAADLASPLLGDLPTLKSELLCEAGEQAIVFKAVHHSMVTVAVKALSVLPPGLMELMHHFGSLILGHSKHLHGGSTGPGQKIIWTSMAEARKRFSVIHPTQWLASPACVDLLATWLPELTALMQAGCQQTGSMVTRALLDSSMDPYTRAHVHFLNCVLSHFFNIEQAFSADLVLLPHFLRECQSRFRAICQHFMAPSAFMVDDRELAKVDPFNSRNVLPLKDIYVGVECRDYLNTLPNVCGDNDVFLRGCLLFLQTAADEVRRRVPLAGQLLEHLTFLDPEVALRAEGRVSLPSLATLASKLPGDDMDVEKLDAQWLALPGYFSAADADELRKMPVDSMWGIIANMSGSGDSLVFAELGRLAKLALSMPVPDRETASVMRSMERMIVQRGDCVEDNLDQALNLLLPLRLSVQQEAGDCDKFRPTIKHRKFYALDVGKRTEFEEDIDLFKSNEA